MKVERLPPLALPSFLGTSVPLRLLACLCGTQTGQNRIFTTGVNR